MVGVSQCGVDLIAVLFLMLPNLLSNRFILLKYKAAHPLQLPQKKLTQSKVT
jgi:hypothetical protein